jgi:hypothetical protein
MTYPIINRGYLPLTASSYMNQSKKDNVEHQEKNFPTPSALTFESEGTLKIDSMKVKQLLSSRKQLSVDQAFNELMNDVYDPNWIYNLLTAVESRNTMNLKNLLRHVIWLHPNNQMAILSSAHNLAITGGTTYEILDLIIHAGNTNYSIRNIDGVQVLSREWTYGTKFDLSKEDNPRLLICINKGSPSTFTDYLRISSIVLLAISIGGLAISCVLLSSDYKAIRSFALLSSVTMLGACGYLNEKQNTWTTKCFAEKFLAKKEIEKTIDLCTKYRAHVPSIFERLGLADFDAQLMQAGKMALEQNRIDLAQRVVQAMRNKDNAAQLDDKIKAITC